LRCWQRCEWGFRFSRTWRCVHRIGFLHFQATFFPCKQTTIIHFSMGFQAFKMKTCLEGSGSECPLTQNHHPHKLNSDISYSFIY